MKHHWELPIDSLEILAIAKILLTLVSQIANSLLEALSLFWAHVCLEIVRVYDFVGVLHDLILALIMITWRNQCAFGTPRVKDKISLQINSLSF